MVTADEQLLDDDGERIPWPFALGGDKGYRADWIDEYLLDLGVTPVIPSKQNQDRDARLVDFDREAYRRRNIIERLIGWLNSPLKNTTLASSSILQRERSGRR